jgi:hypothetical protein
MARRGKVIAKPKARRGKAKARRGKSKARRG